MLQHSSAEFLGVGIYPLSEAARLLRTHINTLRWWTGDRADSNPIIHRDFPNEGILTFAEFMELQFVKMFRDEKVFLQTIRRAAHEAARMFSTTHPFAVKRFDTNGRSIFATLVSQESELAIVEELRHGQLVFRQIIKPFFRKLKYTGFAVGQYWPLGTRGRIVLDPLRRHGDPIDSETGVPVVAIINALNAGGGQDETTVAQWFDVPLEAVKAAIRFNRSLVARRTSSTTTSASATQRCCAHFRSMLSHCASSFLRT